MGHARWDSAAWSRYARSTRGKSRAELFRAHGMDPALDPTRIRCRESRDSDLNPASTPLIVAVDVTGSMGMLAEMLVREGLEPLFEEVLARRPISDPHVMAMAIGDAWCDDAPLQVTQFEADITVAHQIRDIWIEGGGGGNRFESYNLPWYFAATRTSTDSLEKRGRKGYLFTVGDEPCPPVLEADHIRRVLGDEARRDLPTADVLAMAERGYEVFHVIVEEGHYAASAPEEVRRSWTRVLGQRVLQLADHRRLSEVIVSAIEVNEGRDVDEVSASWSGDTALVVAGALANLTPGNGRGDGPVLRF